MEISKVRKEVEDLFFLTQNRVIEKKDCQRILEELRKQLGITEPFTDEEFEKRFGQRPQPPQPPAGQPLPPGAKPVEVDMSKAKPVEPKPEEKK